MNTTLSRYRPAALGLATLLLAGVAPLPALANAAAGAMAQGSSAADPQTEAARAMIDKMASQAVAFLADKSLSDDQKRDQFRTLLIHDYDMDTIGRFALGTYWNQLNPQQRQEYQKDFREMIVRVYSSRFESYNGQSFKTTAAHADPSSPGDTIVSSVIIPADGQGPQVQVDWRIRQKGSAYRVVDVVVEGVSMAVTQRSDFSSVIQQNGGNIDALLGQLRNQVAGAPAPMQQQRPAR